MNKFDESCGTTADELLGNIDYYSKKISLKKNINTQHFMKQTAS